MKITHSGHESVTGARLALWPKTTEKKIIKYIQQLFLEDSRQGIGQRVGIYRGKPRNHPRFFPVDIFQIVARTAGTQTEHRGPAELGRQGSEFQDAKLAGVCKTEY